MVSLRRPFLRVSATTWAALALLACSSGGSGGGAADTVPPTIVWTSPANGAVDVAPAGAVVTAMFSEAMDPATVAQGTFVLRDPGGALVPGAVGYGANVATFTPAAQIGWLTTYTATISGAKDLAGNVLAQPVSWSFTTAAEPDTTPPYVVSYFPASGAVGVSPGAHVSVTFSEPMDAASTSGALSLSGPGGAVPAAVVVEGATATLTPAAPLDGLTVYTANLTTAALDLHGNPLASPLTWSFTTVDTTSPFVTSVLPSDAATNVDVGVEIALSFSETMDGATVDASTFQVQDPLGAPITGTIRFGGNAASFLPAAPLAPATAYTVVASATMTDPAGNPLSPAFSSTFTTTGPGTGTWTAMAAATALAPYAARAEPSAVWTGSEVVVWGGEYGGPQGQVYVLANGGRYAPATDSWQAIPSNLAQTPGGRFGHATVWTGSKMIVWGGTTVGGLTNTGGVFDPSGSGAWTPTTTTGAPAARANPAAAWAKTEMIVWGGWDPTGFDAYDGTGGRYAPATDTWSTVSALGAPTPRAFAAAVWTGSRLLVWGGIGATGALGDGASYDPVADAWQPLASGGPSPRWSAAAVWTGSRLIVWGGTDTVGPLGDGAAYDPATDTWSAMAASGAPPPRAHPPAMWTGNRMIVWGGSGANPLETQTGGLYDPVGDAWALTALDGAPSARYAPAAVWTGTELVVWGGQGAAGALDDGARFAP